VSGKDVMHLLRGRAPFQLCPKWGRAPMQEDVSGILEGVVSQAEGCEVYVRCSAKTHDARQRGDAVEKSLIMTDLDIRTTCCTSILKNAYLETCQLKPAQKPAGETVKKTNQGFCLTLNELRPIIRMPTASPGEDMKCDLVVLWPHSASRICCDNLQVHH
jgi:hypothetical protein